MAMIDIGTTVASQLGAGASVLAAARTLDTRLIKARLAAFEGAQRAYSAAHDKVHAAEQTLNAAQVRLGELDATQDQAVTTLAATLIGDGQPRTNPFAAFGALAPGKLMNLPVAAEAKAIHQLVTAVQRAKGVSKPTLQAALAADKAARAVEQALLQMEKLQTAVRDARHTREAVAQTWANALAGLKRGARAAVDEGAPMLYATLFDRPHRPNGKAAKSAPPPTPEPAPQPAPQAAATPAA